MKKVFSGLLLTMLAFSSALLGAEENHIAVDYKLQSDEEKQQSSKTKEALDTIQGYLQALRDHNIDKAYYAFTSSSFRSATPRETFHGFIFENSVLLKNQTADFSAKPVFQNNLLIFQGTLTSIDNDEKVVEFALTQEGGQWKILGIKVFSLKSNQ